MSLMVATTPVSWPSSSSIWLVRITTRRSMPLSVCRRTVALGADGCWFKPTRTPQFGLAHGALKDLLAVLAEHLFAGHAEELFRSPVDPGDAVFGIV